MNYTLPSVKRDPTLGMTQLQVMQMVPIPGKLAAAGSAAQARADAARARDLILHLAAFFRKNLKRPANLATLREELEHVGAYLEIEKARFADRLTVEAVAARAARILDMMQRDGIIGPPDGSRPRDVLKRPDWLSEVESSLR